MSNSMPVSSYVLFTTKYCASCAPLKTFLSKAGLNGEMIDAAEGDGAVKAESMGIKGVPTVVFFDEKRNELGRASSVSDVREILSD